VTHRMEGLERAAVPARFGWPGMFSECGPSRLVRIRPPDSQARETRTTGICGARRGIREGSGAARARVCTALMGGYDIAAAILALRMVGLNNLWLRDNCPHLTTGSRCALDCPVEVAYKPNEITHSGSTRCRRA
jgi:hypothetical protein